MKKKIVHTKERTTEFMRALIPTNPLSKHRQYKAFPPAANLAQLSIVNHNVGGSAFAQQIIWIRDIAKLRNGKWKICLRNWFGMFNEKIKMNCVSWMATEWIAFPWCRLMKTYICTQDSDSINIILSRTYMVARGWYRNISFKIRNKVLKNAWYPIYSITFNCSMAEILPIRRKILYIQSIIQYFQLLLKWLFSIRVFFLIKT